MFLIMELIYEILNVVNFCVINETYSFILDKKAKEN
jgi:hypothetical protein